MQLTECFLSCQKVLELAIMYHVPTMSVAAGRPDLVGAEGAQWVKGGDVLDGGIFVSDFGGAVWWKPEDSFVCVGE